ncbi:MAG: hypothetical protein RLZ81_435 [Pseudomonadota bacterium]
MSPAGPKARLSILIFHRVLNAPDPLFPNEMHARQFDAVCGWLARWFNVLPLEQAVHTLKAGQLPARSACITFDDGYADNHQVALPILERHGLSATFFIATGFLDGGRMWNDTIIETVRACHHTRLDLTELELGAHALASLQDKQAAIAALIDAIKYRSVPERVALTEQVASLAQVQPPRDLMMSSHQVQLMRQAGMGIGAHTVSHPILARLSDDDAREEILASKLMLEELLDERIGLFAYPNGKHTSDYLPATVDIVRGLGFDAAVTTERGTTGREDDIFQIRRFTPWDRTRFRFGSRLVDNIRRSQP